MVNYTINGSYKVGGRILTFDKKIAVNKGVVTGDDLEGRMDSMCLTFRTDDMTYRFAKRFDVQDSAIYSGRVFVEGIFLGDAVATLSPNSKKTRPS
jgi:hypothetical protein